MNKLGQNLCWLLGIVLVAVGVLGFVLPSPLLGYFEVDTLHNVVHLVSGLIGLWAASQGVATSRLFLLIFGVVYGAVTVIGFAMGGSILGLFMVNMADNYLHAVIAAVCLGFGFNMSKA
ncbi:MAG: conserved membrane protein of unknown function [Candidatus Peregrinibacteria bacterium Gr01-1014_25]|nr:MAG: conserved membrane protein of unknown function [Candidatus Peregrinibacteria bacterium Gr01-1014_25]